MENNSLNWLKTPLERLYWKYVERRAMEIVENDMTCRLIIDFRKGAINGLQDQQQIAGASMINFGLSKMD